RLVALLFTHLDHTRDLVRFSFTHEVRDSHVDHENLQGRHSSRRVDALEKVLRDYAFERLGQRGSDLVLLVGGEDVDDTIDRFGSARGVEGSENKVSGRGRRQ